MRSLVMPTGVKLKLSVMILLLLNLSNHPLTTFQLHFLYNKEGTRKLRCIVSYHRTVHRIFCTGKVSLFSSFPFTVSVSLSCPTLSNSWPGTSDDDGEVTIKGTRCTSTCRRLGSYLTGTFLTQLGAAATNESTNLRLLLLLYLFLRRKFNLVVLHIPFNHPSTGPHTHCTQ